jgi:hypothetical protein
MRWSPIYIHLIDSLSSNEFVEIFIDSLDGNGWMHNLHLIEARFSCPFLRLNHSRRRRRELERDTPLLRLRNYRRIRYLTLNYSLHDSGTNLKWLSLTHLHLIIAPDTVDTSTMINTISMMPILTTLTIQAVELALIELLSCSTLTSIDIRTSFSREIDHENFSIIGELPNLRVLTLGAGMKVRYCLENSLPCLETLTVGRATPELAWRSMIKQSGSLRALTDHYLTVGDVVYLVDHAPHLTSLSVRTFYRDGNHECLNQIAKLTNLKHLSLDGAKPMAAQYPWQSLKSLVNLRSLSILNFDTHNHELLSLVQYLDASRRDGGNGQLITINDVDVNEWVLGHLLQLS